MMKMRCILIEDEPLAMEKLKGFILKHPFLELDAAFDNGVDALVYLQTHSIDLVFLDINLGELSGIQMLETNKIDAKIILTTAYPDYALKGYELNITDYLLKPFTFDRFMQAVEKAQNPGTKNENLQPKPFLLIKTEYRLEKILLDDILYIEGMGDYRRIFTSQKNIMTLQTFKDLEQEIPSALICRVHKSYMVSVDKIESIEKDEIQIGNKVIPIGDSYKKSFYTLIQGK